MKEVTKIDPNWPPCAIEFEGWDNVTWLLRLPLKQNVTDLELILNHPWHGHPVAIKFRGVHKKRSEVNLYVQEDPNPVYPQYNGGGHGLFV